MSTLRFGIALCIVLLRHEYAVSCSCEPLSTIAEAFEQGELVVLGKVVSRDTVLITHPSGKPSRIMFGYAMVPDRIFKGVRADTLYVHSGSDTEQCGFMFTIGESYVVYADVVDAMKGYNDDAVWMTWVTSRCTRTRAFDEEEVRYLEKRKK